MGRQWHNLRSAATSLALFFIISVSIPSAKADNKTYPTANQNLSPMQAWESSEYCLQKTSTSCQDTTYNYTLTNSGWLNVTRAHGQEFCEPNSCADHTRTVLVCLYEVKRDYWFANNATVKDLNDTINIGCDPNQGFTGVSKYGSHSHGFRLNSAPILTAATASAVLFMALF